MTDQTAHDVTDDDRRFARDWAAFIIRTPFTSMPMEAAAARVILDAVPAPPPKRPTLADMTRAERRACQWMQCDTVHAGRGVILQSDDEGMLERISALVLFKGGTTCGHSHHLVTPRPDLPRMEWPDTGQEAGQ